MNNDDIVHPNLKVLGCPVTTNDGDFEHMAFCETPLGKLYFNRMAAPGKPAEHYGYWQWGIETAHREADDFDTLDDENKYVGLDLAVRRADRSLRGIIKNLAAIKAINTRVFVEERVPNGDDGLGWGAPPTWLVTVKGKTSKHVDTVVYTGPKMFADEFARLLRELEVE
jgi:hypothetical protein